MMEINLNGKQIKLQINEEKLATMSRLVEWAKYSTDYERNKFLAIFEVNKERGLEIDDIIDNFEDWTFLEVHSAEELGQEMEHGLGYIPDHLRGYIDFKKYGQELLDCGEWNLTEYGAVDNIILD